MVCETVVWWQADRVKNLIEKNLEHITALKLLLSYDPKTFKCVTSINCAAVHSSHNMYLCVPGLFKGSVTPNSETTSQCSKLERPTTLRQLKNIYNPQENTPNGCNDGYSKNDYVTTSSPSSRHSAANTVTANGTDKTVSMSILSPFDEQEEWAKISEIMASFGNGVDHKSIVTELEQEFESRLGKRHFDFQKYWRFFIEFGLFDKVARLFPFCVEVQNCF